MKDILVVGSVALDSVQTPAEKSEEALGGSAVYFSLAARLFAKVHLVGVVGSDFPIRHRQMLESKGIGIQGLETVPGKTFRWSGAYGRDLNCAKTHETQLNVFESFRPRLSSAQRSAPAVFLANIDPELQWEVLSQMDKPRLVACDTMNFWIQMKGAAIKELLSRVDIFFVNEEEARALSQESNTLRCARRLSEWGPPVVVIKKGEHGAVVLAGGKLHAFPAYPVEDVRDPTGAGDSFAGGFLGYLGSGDSLQDTQRIKRAMVYGTILASYNVQEFSTRALEGLDLPMVSERYRDYLSLLPVGEDVLVA